MEKNNSVNLSNNIYSVISIHNCVRLLLITTPFFSIIGNAALNISIVLILLLIYAFSIKVFKILNKRYIMNNIKIVLIEIPGEYRTKNKIKKIIKALRSPDIINIGKSINSKIKVQCTKGCYLL